MKFLAFKSLLNLLASSVSLVALLLTTNITIATPQINDTTVINTSQPKQNYLSLNIANPQLALTNQQDKQLSEHLGCSCPLCS